MNDTIPALSQESSDRWEPIRELPPSAKLVAKELDRYETLTQTELAEVTLLSTRTVREAVGRLEDNDAIESHVYTQDARKRVYRLTL